MDFPLRHDADGSEVDVIDPTGILPLIFSEMSPFMASHRLLIFSQCFNWMDPGDTHFPEVEHLVISCRSSRKFTTFV